METITHFIETGMASSEKEFKGEVDIILSSTSPESLKTAQKIKEGSKKYIIIHADGNLNYHEKILQTVLERQVERTHQLLTRKYARETVLVISHKEIIERLMAKTLQVPLEESRRMRGYLNGYHYLYRQH